MFNSSKSMICAGVLALAITLGGWMGTGAAQADDCYSKPRYKAVVVYVTQEQPYQVWVTTYDHCGKPIKKLVTRIRTVQVPRVKYVRVY
ncbi:MAG: hypothetical protein R3C03_17840 [Pirellulaceae bacterium]